MVQLNGCVEKPEQKKTVNIKNQKGNSSDSNCIRFMYREQILMRMNENPEPSGRYANYDACSEHVFGISFTPVSGLIVCEHANHGENRWLVTR